MVRRTAGFLSALLTLAGVGALTETGFAQKAGGLQLLNPVVSQFEDAPALGTARVVAGETVYFRVSVGGYKVSDASKVQLTGQVQFFDPRGTAIASKEDVVIATFLRQEDKDWKPALHAQVQIPSITIPGVYKVRFSVTDEQTHLNASGETTFGVDGPVVPPSDTLVVRGLSFLRTQSDEAALKNPAYRAGDMIWVRFDITGYKFGEQNAIDVAYDVAVLNAEGKQLFGQEDAAVEKSQAFYPQPWIPGTFSLTLQPNTTPGIYAVTITARDAIGNQKQVETGHFRVE